MKYQKERDFIVAEIKRIYAKYAQQGIDDVTQKTQFDLVTNIDIGIEKELTESILNAFPNDKIHGEETSNTQEIVGRTWTIDPIDGTCNMSGQLPLYGVQCALFEQGEVVFSVIYLPHFGETLVAEKGCGCYLNGKRVEVKRHGTLNNALVSFGDYPHYKTPEVAERQHRAIAHLITQIAKIRMFGAACIDFAFVAAGRTDGTVVITRNLWDIAPGILMCQEAGAILTNLEGQPYKFGDSGVVASATKELSQLIATAFAE
ncbi:MAG: inositol monophosphatase [Clostridiales bacterium]|nr:inositol monophosphatase [Clostridiales bacterium]